MSTKQRRKPYMPDSDIGKKTWMEQFLMELERDPVHYGFDDKRMFEYIQHTIRAFIDAVQVTLSKSHRSASTVAMKNRLRADAVAMCRSIAMDLKADPEITEAEKRSLGLRTRTAEPEDAKLPQGLLAGAVGYPALSVLSSPNGGHVIRYRDITSHSKAKPNGVSHMLLFAAVGEKPDMLRTHARLLGAYTKHPFEITYPTGCNLEGLYVTYYGRWLTTRGEMSPWSPGISKIIGDAQVNLREVDFTHLFGKEGFIDAVPEGATRRVVEDRPMLESVANEQDTLFEVLEPKMLPMHGFALLKTEAPAQVEEDAA